MVLTDRAGDIRDGLFLEYQVEGSTGPGQTRAAAERLIFRQENDGRLQVQLEAEEVAAGLYTAAYGDPIIVDEGLVAGNGKPFQFRGLCPLLLKPAECAPDAEVAWPWDGAGVEPMSDDPEEQIIVTAVATGPVRWRNWSVWVLKRTDTPPHVPSPVAYYEQATGLLVGVEYGADMPGMGRFVYCDAELQATNAGRLQGGAR